MTMIKFKPTREQLKDSMVPFGHLFDTFFNDGGRVANSTTGYFRPAVDVKETDTSFDLLFALPGLEKSDVKIELKDNHLLVSGERKLQKEESTGKFHRVENLYGSFSRSFVLPENVNAENISAEFKNGMLQIVLPKTEKAAPKTIEIK